MEVGSTIKVPISKLPHRGLERVMKELTFENGNGEQVECYRLILSEGYLRVARGAWDVLPRLDYVDRRSKPELPELNFTVKLDAIEKDERFEGQSAAVASMFEHEQGLIVRAPGTGKTQIALAFAARCKTRTLVIVHTHDILEQWIEYIENAIPELKGKVGVIQGKRNKVGHITVATVQTLNKMVATEPKSYWRQFGCVIADEAHHGAAPSWEAVLNMQPAFYRFGFTASPTRADGMQRVMRYNIGPIIHRQRFTSPVKLHVEFVDTGFYAPYRGPFDWTSLVDRLVTDPKRNKMIAQRADQEIEKGNSVLVLSRRIEHLELIAEQMWNDVEILAAATRTKKERTSVLADFKSGKVKCVLATQLADEALDVPRLNRVLLTHPGKHDGRLVQQIGRAIRTFAGKEDAVIVDFRDKRVGVLRSQADKRKRAYRKNSISIKMKGRLAWRR